MNVHARPDGTTILMREDRDGIALLTLNNPAARNALSEELIAERRAEAAREEEEFRAWRRARAAGNDQK